MNFTVLASQIEYSIAKMEDAEHEERFCIAPNI